MAEIKADESLDQDLMDGIWCVTYNARDVATSRQSISDLTAMN